MRIINFSEEDIKQCKLALAKTSLTPLQSAFLMQYITNIEQENKQLKDNWNKLKEYIKQEPTSDFYNDKLPFEVIMVKIINKMTELERGVSDER